MHGVYITLHDKNTKSTNTTDEKATQRTWLIPLMLKFTSIRLPVHLYIQYGGVIASAN